MKTRLNPYFSQLTWCFKLTSSNSEAKHAPFLDWMARTLTKDYQLVYLPDGLPVIKYPFDRCLKYNPVLIAAEGLAAHSSFYRDNSKQNKIIFKAASQWLLNNIKIRDTTQDKFGVWLFEYPWSTHKGCLCIPPWTSSLAQGLGISLLLRYAQDTGDVSALRVASLAFKSFFYTVEEGGVISLSEEGLPIFEEYGCIGRSTPLNGWIFSILGLYEYAKATDNPTAWSYFELAIKSLTNHIKKYDQQIWLLHWSKYDNKTHPIASRRYHKTHVSQLEVLFSITKRSEFARLHHKWQTGDRALGPLIDVFQLLSIVLRFLKKSI